MVLVNFATKEIVAKLVYYGPALCGKTTNLQYIFTRLNPKKRGKMISLATEADRTLFFDFLPLEFGTVQGFKIRFQLYTVPGQVFYGATRKLVLKGADAVIFVADSQVDVMDRNVESIEDMKTNLIENGLDPETIPLIIQYNKRDLTKISPVEELEEKVNYRGVPSFEASAVEGFGVMEAFKESTKLLLQDLKRKHSFINLDSVTDMPFEVFEQKEELPVEEVLDAEVEYELELGSAVEGAGEDVVAGELLDQIETISLADACQAEAFLDDYRKGVPTEEAKQKAERVNVSAADSSISPARNEQLFAAAWEMQGDVAERAGRKGMVDSEIAPIDLSPIGPAAVEPSEGGDEFEIMRDSIPMDEVPPPAASPTLQTELEQQDSFLGEDMTMPEMMEPDGVVFGGEEEAPEAAAGPDEAFGELYRELDMEVAAPVAPPAKPAEKPQAAPGMPRPKPGPEPRMAEPVRPARQPEPPSRPMPAGAPEHAVTPQADLSGLSQGLDGIMSAVERIDGRLTELGREVAGLKSSLARHGHSAEQPHAEPQAGNLSARVDELEGILKGIAEGQDRLMLSVLEAVREAKRSNSDSHEKLEDAVKYLIDRVRGDDKTPGKKKWF